MGTSSLEQQAQNGHPQSAVGPIDNHFSTVEVLSSAAMHSLPSSPGLDWAGLFLGLIQNVTNVAHETTGDRTCLNSLYSLHARKSEVYIPEDIILEALPDFECNRDAFAPEIKPESYPQIYAAYTS